jgi:hypothetical protein
MTKSRRGVPAATCPIWYALAMFSSRIIPLIY